MIRICRGPTHFSGVICRGVGDAAPYDVNVMKIKPVILLKGIELLSGKPLRISNVREAKDLVLGCRRYGILRRYAPQNDTNLTALGKTPALLFYDSAVSIAGCRAKIHRKFRLSVS